MRPEHPDCPHKDLYKDLLLWGFTIIKEGIKHDKH
jgi:hypothetical protein